MSNTFLSMFIKISILNNVCFYSFILVILGGFSSNNCYANDIPTIDEFVKMVDKRIDQIESIQHVTIPIYDPGKPARQKMTTCYQRNPLRLLVRKEAAHVTLTHYWEKEGDRIYKYGYQAGNDGIERIHVNKRDMTHQRLMDNGLLHYLLGRNYKQDISIDSIVEGNQSLWRVTIAEPEDRQYILFYDKQSMLLQKKMTIIHDHQEEKTTVDYLSVNQGLSDDCFDIGAPEGTPIVHWGASKSLDPSKNWQPDK